MGVRRRRQVVKLLKWRKLWRISSPKISSNWGFIRFEISSRISHISAESFCVLWVCDQLWYFRCNLCKFRANFGRASYLRFCEETQDFRRSQVRHWQFFHRFYNRSRRFSWRFNGSSDTRFVRNCNLIYSWWLKNIWFRNAFDVDGKNDGSLNIFTNEDETIICKAIFAKLWPFLHHPRLLDGFQSAKSLRLIVKQLNYTPFLLTLASNVWRIFKQLCSRPASISLS